MADNASTAPRTIPTAAELDADRAEAMALVDVSRETSTRLDDFVQLLLQQSVQQNLISRSTLPQIWTRHVADCLQLLALAPAAQTWVDLGSGAGLPGLVIACALAGQDGAMVHLVESVGKKAAFLRDATTRLHLPAQIHNVRIEDFGKNFRERADVVTARALAPLDQLLRLAQPLLTKKSTVGLFPKGQDVDAELTEASKYWNIDASLVPSITSPNSRIVVVRGLQRRPQKK